MDSQFLYRGISERQYQETGRRLVPKLVDSFEYACRFDGTWKFDGSVTLGPSERNAVLRHQLNQEGFPTSGVSTTPLFDRARFYATRGGEDQSGFVFKIDRSLLGRYGVKEYVDADWVSNPSFPEDREVILVARDFGSLPGELVTQVIQV